MARSTEVRHLLSVPQTCVPKERTTTSDALCRSMAESSASIFTWWIKVKQFACCTSLNQNLNSKTKLPYSRGRNKITAIFDPSHLLTSTWPGRSDLSTLQLLNLPPHSRESSRKFRKSTLLAEVTRDICIIHLIHALVICLHGDRERGRESCVVYLILSW